MFKIVISSKNKFSEPLNRNNLFILEKYLFVYFEYLSIVDKSIRLYPSLFSKSSKSFLKLYKYHVQLAIISMVGLLFIFDILLFANF